MGGAYRSEIRFCERFVAWLDANLPALPEDSPVRMIAEDCGTSLARRCKLPSLGSHAPLGSLDDASAELQARLEEAGAEPMTPLTPEQWAIVGAGLPFTLDEITEHAEQTARQWARTDGLSPDEIVTMLGGYLVVVGALVQGWRR